MKFFNLKGANDEQVMQGVVIGCGSVIWRFDSQRRVVHSVYRYACLPGGAGDLFRWELCRDGRTWNNLHWLGHQVLWLDSCGCLSIWSMHSNRRFVPIDERYMGRVYEVNRQKISDSEQEVVAVFRCW